MISFFFTVLNYGLRFPLFPIRSLYRIDDPKDGHYLLEDENIFIIMIILILSTEFNSKNYCYFYLEPSRFKMLSLFVSI